MAGVGGLSNVGLNCLADAIIGGSSFDKFNNTNARLAVGNSTDAYDAADTDLQGASKARLPMLATYPQRTNNVLEFQATADGSTANFAWEEWAIANHASAGQMLCRFVQTLGTKGSGTTWNATATVTIVHA